MTHTTDDGQTELRNILQHLQNSGHAVAAGWQTVEDAHKAMDTAEAAILELVKREREAGALDGRIDELQKLDTVMDDDAFTYHWPTEDGEYYDVNKYTTDRLAALRQQEGDKS